MKVEHEENAFKITEKLVCDMHSNLKSYGSFAVIDCLSAAHSRFRRDLKPDSKEYRDALLVQRMIDSVCRAAHDLEKFKVNVYEGDQSQKSVVENSERRAILANTVLDIASQGGTSIK